MPGPLAIQDLDYVLKNTLPLWNELRGGRLFITGGTGFFGCWLLETFCHANSKLQLGAQIVVLTRDQDAFCQKMPHLANRPDLVLKLGDVRSFDYPRGSFTHVIHAATTPGSAAPSAEIFDTIVTGTRRVIDFAVIAGANKLIFTSSGAVYGSSCPQVGAISEESPTAPDPTDPNSAYGEGKRAAELLCAMAHATSGLEAKIARCFSFVGPHLPLNTHFAMGNFIRDALNGDPIVVKDGTPFRSYMYAADLAIWLWTILLRGTPARPYNVGSSEAVLITELARAISAQTGSNIQVLPASDEVKPPSYYVPDIHRAREELVLPEPLPLADALSRTFRWFHHAVADNNIPTSPNPAQPRTR